MRLSKHRSLLLALVVAFNFSLYRFACGHVYQRIQFPRHTRTRGRFGENKAPLKTKLHQTHPHSKRQLEATIQNVQKALRARVDDMFCSNSFLSAFDSLPLSFWSRIDNGINSLLLTRISQALVVCGRSKDSVTLLENLIKNNEQTFYSKRDPGVLRLATSLLISTYVTSGESNKFYDVCGGIENSMNTRDFQSENCVPAFNTRLKDAVRKLLTKDSSFNHCTYMSSFDDILFQRKTAITAGKDNAICNISHYNEKIFFNAAKKLASLVKKPYNAATMKGKYKALANALSFSLGLHSTAGYLNFVQQQPINSSDSSASLSDYGNWQKAESLPSLNDFRCNIPRINASTITPEEFQTQYLLLQRPVILVGMSNNWTAHTTWRKEHFLPKYGHLNMSVTRGSKIAYNKIQNITSESQLMSIREYARRHMRDACEVNDTACNADPMYILDQPQELQFDGGFPDPLIPWFTPKYRYFVFEICIPFALPATFSAVCQ